MSNPTDPDPQLPTIKIHHPVSPRRHSATPSATPTSTARRRIGVAVDLSDESAYSVGWAVHHYTRPGDAVVLLHVRPTSVLFGADWGSSGGDAAAEPRSQERLEEDFDAFAASKLSDLAVPLREAQIPYKIHIVKDHDMRERLCLEVERLGLSAVIMGSRGFGAAERRGGDGRLGSVSDYCVNHCVCPVVVVRYPEGKGGGGEGGAVVAVKPEGEDEPVVVQENNVADAKKDA